MNTSRDIQSLRLHCDPQPDSREGNRDVGGGVESAEAETQRESWHCGGKVWEVLLDSSPSSGIGECFTGENGKQSQRPGSRIPLELSRVSSN